MKWVFVAETKVVLSHRGDVTLSSTWTPLFSFYTTSNVVIFYIVGTSVNPSWSGWIDNRSCDVQPPGLSSELYRGIWQKTIMPTTNTQYFWSFLHSAGTISQAWYFFTPCGSVLFAERSPSITQLLVLLFQKSDFNLGVKLRFIQKLKNGFVWSEEKVH